MKRLFPSRNVSNKYSKIFSKIGWKMYVEEDAQETQLIMEYDEENDHYDEEDE